MEHNTKAPCEKNLMRDIDLIVNAGIHRASTLCATPRLYDMFMKDLATWLSEVGCRQKNILAIARRIWFAPGDRVELHELVDPMVNQVLTYIFREGKRETNPDPTLNAILKVAHEGGSQDVICYLMQVADNYARDEQRKFNTHCEHYGEKCHYDGNQEKSVADPGTIDDRKGISPEETLTAQEISNAILTQLGQKFPSDVVFLAKRTARLNREEIADYFAEGKLPELVENISHELSFQAGRDCSPFLGLLRQKANSYILPSRLKKDRKALVNYLFRQTNGTARDEFDHRGKACSL